MTEPVLEVRGLQKYFPVSTGHLRHSQGWVKAVEAIDFAIHPGETLGLIGEVRLRQDDHGQVDPSAGETHGRQHRVRWRDILCLKGRDLMRYRREVQVVFQDPFSSLSPRMRVGDIIAEPLEIHTTSLSGAAVSGWRSVRTCRPSA